MVGAPGAPLWRVGASSWWRMSACYIRSHTAVAFHVQSLAEQMSFLHLCGSLEAMYHPLLYTRTGSYRGNPRSTIKYCTANIHTHSNVAAGVRCRRRCRLRCRLGWCTWRAYMARRCFVLVPVHMGVCCAGMSQCCSQPNRWQHTCASGHSLQRRRACFTRTMQLIMSLSVVLQHAELELSHAGVTQDSSTKVRAAWVSIRASSFTLWQAS